MADPSALAPHYDVVVVGGGHNGLTAAAYLARAGVSVLVLERLGQVGGAAVSARPFPGFDARLSRWSYLVSLLPEQLQRELDLGLRLVSRTVSSYTPYDRGGIPDGLLVERPEGPATAASFRRLTGSDDEYAAWHALYAEIGTLARVVAPTLMSPLPREDDVRVQVDPTTWHDVVQAPLGEAIERRFSDDTVRGVVATDALIGTSVSLHDPSLAQNRCFLYHVVGGGTGEWRVPVGGMGAVTDALARAAVGAGAVLETGCEVLGVQAGTTGEAGDPGGGSEVRWRDETGHRSATAGLVLAGVSPWTLAGLLGDERDPALRPVGAQVKVNLLVDRLPRLQSRVDPEVAFAGTLHLGEDYSRLERARSEAAAGRLPWQLPGEVYCHTLSDASILGDTLAERHTLTYFGLHTPATLFEADPDALRTAALQAAIASLDEHLVDPIASVITRDHAGDPCWEVKIPQDVERELAMPGGHIFHGDLEWPWASRRAALGAPAEQWGVQTGRPGVLLCGAGSRRGGAVSGLGGHSAAMAALAILGG